MTTSLLDNAPWQQHLFNGDWIKASNGNIDVIEPATGKILTSCGQANTQDVLKAASKAAKAQKEWMKVTPRDKAQIFLKAADYLQQNFAEFSLIIARETGGIIPKGQLEIQETIVILQLASNMVLQPNGVTLPSPVGRSSAAKRMPLGVVGVISPFNFPMILSSRSVAPALATGNAVVSKPDPQTPVSGGFLLAMALEHAGLPKGVYQVMPGGVDAGIAICEAPEIGLVCFTGSTVAGRKVGEACGRNLKKVSLELGGKNSLIILEDADIDVAASNIAWGAFLHQGQICMASGRILVHSSIAPAITAKVIEKARHLPMGDPVSGSAIGPLINEIQVQKVTQIVEDSIAQGAVLEIGAWTDNLFYAPTVLTNVKPGMRCFEEEIFGPVANIVTFDNDEEAAKLANLGNYGLAAGIISNDVSRAIILGEQLNVGLLHINDQTVNDECINPFGGCGDSGNGSTVCGPSDWDLYTHWQWSTMRITAQAKPF
jgi:benzaldehyde dehydrogenase (NAD)